MNANVESKIRNHVHAGRPLAEAVSNILSIGAPKPNTTGTNGQTEIHKRNAINFFFCKKKNKPIFLFRIFTQATTVFL